MRPPPVGAAVADYIERIGATPGRGGYRRAVEAGRILLQCRLALARLLDIPGDPGRIAFMFNATHALNTALHGLLKPGDVAVRTVYDHNAVRRPLARLADGGVRVRCVGGDVTGSIDMAALHEALQGARLLVVNGASNVLGTVADVRTLVDAAHKAGALVLLDAAQTAGSIPMSVRESGVDMIALTAHKALLGPQGVGALWVRADVDIKPLLAGGSGGSSERLDMPASWPDHLEAGTQNGPGIAGWLAGVQWLLEHDVAGMHRAQMDLRQRLWQGLSSVDGVNLISPQSAGVPIVTFEVAGRDAGSIAHRLEEEYNIATRAGLHCAPDAHVLAGTADRGAIRMSIGWSTTRDEVERALAAVGMVAGKPLKVDPARAN